MTISGRYDKRRLTKLLFRHIVRRRFDRTLRLLRIPIIIVMATLLPLLLFLQRTLKPLFVQGYIALSHSLFREILLDSGRLLLLLLVGGGGSGF